MPHVLIINGPNLNMLGMRQPEIYGTQTLLDIQGLCTLEGQKLGLTVSCFQSNSEGDIVTKIQEARARFQGIIINAGAYTHTSVAIYDALSMVDMPIVEVHLSNIYQREEFRHHSYISPLALGVIAGLGANGYRFALQALAEKCK